MKSMRPGGVQNPRLFGEDLGGIPGVGSLNLLSTTFDHLIRYGGDWYGPVKDAISFISDIDASVGMENYTAEMVDDEKIMYSVYFSRNTGDTIQGNRSAVYRINVPYKISKVNIFNKVNLLAIDDEKWRIAAEAATGRAFTSRETQNEIKNATGCILKIEPDGDIIKIDNR